MTPEEVAAREEIRDLVHRYCAEADSGRLAQVAELFTPDGAVEFRGQDHTGPEGILGMFSDSGKRIVASGLSGRLLHTVSTLTVDFESPDVAVGRSYFTVMSPSGADHWGRYRDEYVRQDGRWRFRHRKISVDGRVPGGFGEVLA